jgi:hypothetical protein
MCCIGIIASADVGIVQVVMHSFWRGVDRQILLELTGQSFHLKPVGRLSLLRSQYYCQAAA